MASKLSKRWKLIHIALLCVLAPAASQAQSVNSGPAHISAMTDLKSLSEDEMKQQTGGAEPLSMNLASNQSTVTGNQLGNVGATGVVSANSLANNSGLTTLIANSGNQVVISQSTVVNVFLH
jgi:hypothetical protein